MESNGPNNNCIKVGIVDDHVSVAKGYTALLNSMNGIRAVLEAYNGEQALKQLETMEELPDILLMDVDMKVMNGIVTTEKISELYPDIKVIALSGVDNNWNIRKMYGAGARAFLAKDVSSETIEKAIHQVHKEGKYLSDLYHLYAQELKEYSEVIKDVTFTEKEKRFLQLFCKGYAYAEIAAEMQVAVNTVKYYFSCVSRKLELKNPVIIAFEVVRMGIVSLNNNRKP
jgi:DNA-binding NarL/FixJ family response regulator